MLRQLFAFVPKHLNGIFLLEAVVLLFLQVELPSVVADYVLELLLLPEKDGLGFLSHLKGLDLLPQLQDFPNQLDVLFDGVAVVNFVQLGALVDIVLESFEGVVQVVELILVLVINEGVVVAVFELHELEVA